MGIEVFLAALGNLKLVAGILLGVGLLMFGWAYMELDIRGNTQPVKRWFRRSAPAMAVAVLVLLIPSTDDLWRVRVDLMKLELASPENVQKLGGHVGEIVKALECKHLNVNCDKPEKSN